MISLASADVNAKIIVDTLASFGVDARVAEINRGPTVTQFGIEPGWEVRTRQVPLRTAEGKALLDKDGQPRTRSRRWRERGCGSTGSRDWRTIWPWRYQLRRSASKRRSPAGR